MKVKIAFDLPLLMHVIPIDRIYVTECTYLLKQPFILIHHE
jgi:hypothetical protein